MGVGVGSDGGPGDGGGVGGGPPVRRLRVDRRRFVTAVLAFFAGLGAVVAGWLGGLFGSGREAPAGGGAGPRRRLFPQRDVEDVPRIPLEQWTIAVDGLVRKPLTIDFAAWGDLPRVGQTVDFHCVEGWTVDEVRWDGVRVADILALAEPLAEATAVSFHAHGGVYLDSLTMEQVRDPQVMLADRLDGEPLPADHGGPVRLVVPAQLAYKSVKWVVRIQVTAGQETGYWEERGYPVQAPVSASLGRSRLPV